MLRECRSHDGHEFGVILGPGLDGIIEPGDFPGNFEFFEVTYRPAQRVFTLHSPGKDLSRIEAEYNPDVVFTTSGPSYWRPRAPHLMGFNLPHHLYPDSPYFSRVLGLRGRMRWRAKSMAVRHYTRHYADAWVVQTDDINTRLRRWLGTDQVHTVPNTISAAYLERGSEAKPADQARAAEPPAVFRLLVLSSYYRHKNLELLNDISALLRQQGIDTIRFTMTLPPADFERTIHPENRGLIDNLGPQRPEECPGLYEKSDALFLPSLLECFSANYVEAMAMSRPIITTDLGFAHTVCGDAALYFEPMNAQQALDRVLQLRTNSNLRNRLVDEGKQLWAGFGTARERAEAYLALCCNLVKARGCSTTNDN